MWLCEHCHVMNKKFLIIKGYPTMSYYADLIIHFTQTQMLDHDISNIINNALTMLNVTKITGYKQDLITSKSKFQK